MDTLSIDNSAPMPVRRPASVAEVCAIVKQARAANEGLYPVGGRTTLAVGLPPIKPGVALDMTALNRVIDYPARDMTITVEAGITLAALQAELAKEGQWLPIDVPSPEKATLGGAIALNKSGPRRYGYGTLRDYVIGISFVTDDGVAVKAGGRVVKNVAGYDLMKLQIGAVGTLGVITQVTLKVKPKPEASAAIVFSVVSDSLGPVLDRLHESKTRPIAVEVLNQAAWKAVDASQALSDEWVIAVGFEEKAVTVAWQLATLRDELKAAAVRDITDEPDPAALCSRLTALQVRPESRLIFKANVQSGKTAWFVDQAARVMPHLALGAHALNGIVFGSVENGHYSEGAAEALLNRHLADKAANVLGTLTIRRCPTDWKKTLPVWGRPTVDRDLMRTVKTTLDPDNVFNPGRLFGEA